MNHTPRKLLAILLVAILAFQLLPTAAFATDNPWTPLAANGKISYTNNVAYVYLTDHVQLTQDIVVDKNKTLHLFLDGFTLAGTGKSSVIRNKGTLHLTDTADGQVTGGIGEKVGGNTRYGGAVYNEGTFYMEGGSLTNNKADEGGGVYNKKNATFTMSGGSITGNSAKEGGGISNAKSATFTLTDGVISYNQSTTNGCGVYNHGDFIMESGSIESNTTEKDDLVYGGGVYNKGTFTMNAGTISHNTNADDGGGVFNTETFTMNGGTISHNEAQEDGAGVYNANNATFTLNQGAITDNVGNTQHNEDDHGGGIYTSTAFLLGTGKITVTGNTAYDALGEIHDSNLFLHPIGDDLTITSTLHSETSIGLSSPTELGTPLVFDGKDSLTNFFSDRPDAVVEVQGETLILVPKEDDKFALTGTVTKGNAPVSGATVLLKAGSETVATATTNSHGQYVFSQVSPATYNLVVTQGSRTVTTLVSMVENTVQNVSLVDRDHSSTLVVKENTPAILVDGLDEAATDKSVTLTVESKSANDAANSDTIVAVAGGQTLSYLDITLVDENDQDLGDSNQNLLEILLPYDFTDKYTVTIYRHHGEEATALTKLTDKAEALDGTFYLDETAGYIHIYASKFSTYAVGYSTTAPGGGSDGGDGDGDGGTTNPNPNPGPGDGDGDGDTTNPNPNPGPGDGDGDDDDDTPPAPSSKPATYKSILTETSNGTASLSATKSRLNTPVTLTVTPDTGYMVDIVSVTYSSGREVSVTDLGDGTFTYKQPGATVTVTVTFAKEKAWPFTDVTADHEAYDAIAYVLEAGLMEGISKTQFAPDLDITRGMIATILHRLAGSPSVDTPATFLDVAPGQYYSDAVAWAQEAGVVTGYSDTQFGPQDSITQEQLVTILYRYLGAPTVTGDLSAYDGHTVSPYALSAMTWAVESGYLTPLNPQALASRGLVATLLHLVA